MGGALPPQGGGLSFQRKRTLILVGSVRWTRREEADFYRVVSTFGVVFDTQQQKFDWSQFRAFARLDKKTDESLEKYYYSFIAMCKRVCRMQVKSETGKWLCWEPGSEPVRAEPAQFFSPVIRSELVWGRSLS